MRSGKRSRHINGYFMRRVFAWGLPAWTVFFVGFCVTKIVYQLCDRSRRVAGVGLLITLASAGIVAIVFARKRGAEWSPWPFFGCDTPRHSDEKPSDD